MKNLKLSLKALGAVALLGGTSLVAAIPAQAQSSLQDVLRAVQRDSEALTAENAQRLREFQAARNEQAASMSTLRGQLNAAEGRGQALANEFQANETQITDLSSQLQEEAGDFGQLLGQFRQAAGETMPVIRNSLASAQYPGRADKLSEIAQARALPSRTDLDSLPKAILQEMVAQSEVTTFTAPVANIGPDGENLTKELLRVGVFNSATTDNVAFAEMRDGKLAAFPKQPPGDFSSAMRNLINAGPDEVVRAPVDPSKGGLFDTYGKLPTLGDRLEDGGIVGAIILFALLPIGLLIGLFKLISLFLMGGAMRSTAKKGKAGSGNPLSRVFQVYEDHRNDQVETLELKLDEQILKESPRIERFNDIVKVLAAVAPLLGLLGTVIGMIITFTAITIYGAGDPQLMADGISTALMTTVFGLVAAIPLLLVHALCAGAARSNQQILDEQAAGLVAERAEKGVAVA